MKRLVTSFYSCLYDRIYMMLNNVWGCRFQGLKFPQQFKQQFLDKKYIFICFLVTRITFSIMTWLIRWILDVFSHLPQTLRCWYTWRYQKCTFINLQFKLRVILISGNHYEVILHERLVLIWSIKIDKKKWHIRQTMVVSSK